MAIGNIQHGGSPAAVWTIGTAIMATLGQAMAAEAGSVKTDDLIEGLFSTVEDFALKSVHPAYLKARDDPILSKVMFLIVLLWLINTFVFSLFNILTCGKCKVRSK